ncbi:mandelate racemase/muconate lactonizing enzyme family protein [Bacillus sp. WMMC1349]|uniref:mandelate racemase/muconate lactonizing enzyme family protein n=1 Tax=Bacillus sp. WMMC1349 TaxID=2736254 RepID=UPI00155365BA|nr:mandelate racemase/muconate lactonizing enzyme family protein [Bacillus sp. WMMC1349]NPC93002.1 mandelate racemase/muconate lactonizing enzyme family protein [Bacillus sp. WMMC1349]
MRIEKVDTFPLFYKLSEPYGDANGYKHYRTNYLIQVTTASGITGWGECVDWLPLLDAGFKKRIIPFLIGKQAVNHTQLIEQIKKWHQRAAAAVSMALTEITAKKAGLSICDLWGGKLREQIPVYASFQSYTNQKDWVNRSLRLIENTVQNGFSQIKIKTGGRSFTEDLLHIQSIQHMFEKKLGLFIDANQSYDLASARKWERYFSGWSNILWFEEPMPFDDLTEYRLLRSTLSVPIAGGENMKGVTQFLPLLREHALDMIQPDVMHGNGIEDFRHTLKLARHFGRRVSPHSYDGALSRVYAAFSQACLTPWTKMNQENIEPLEWDVMDNPFTSLVKMEVNDGYLQVPEKIEVDTDLIQAYLWDGTNYG